MCETTIILSDKSTCVPTEQENFQFAQETVKAEAWLKAKEPLITSREPVRGDARAQTDEVEQLILRHEAFRKAAVTWKERFSSLRQLSAVSLTVDKCLISLCGSHSLMVLKENVTPGFCLVSALNAHAMTSLCLTFCVFACGAFVRALDIFTCYAALVKHHKDTLHNGSIPNNYRIHSF